MIAFKVVEKKTRHCSNVMIYKEYLPTLKAIEKFLRWKRKYPQYFPRYLKGSTIYAADGSVGIMCFESKEAAEKFIESQRFIKISAKIIKVEGIGSKLRPKAIIQWHGAVPMDLIKKGSLDLVVVPPPVGTIAFMAVRVLE